MLAGAGMSGRLALLIIAFAALVDALRVTDQTTVKSV
jgi:hypothetical protein